MRSSRAFAIVALRSTPCGRLRSGEKHVYVLSEQAALIPTLLAHRKDRPAVHDLRLASVLFTATYGKPRQNGQAREVVDAP